MSPDSTWSNENDISSELGKCDKICSTQFCRIKGWSVGSPTITFGAVGQIFKKNNDSVSFCSAKVCNY